MKTQPTAPNKDGITISPIDHDGYVAAMMTAMDQSQAQPAAPLSFWPIVKSLSPYAIAASLVLVVSLNRETLNSQDQFITDEIAWEAVESGFIDIDLEDLTASLTQDDLLYLTNKSNY
jgi:hypothetical protein|tara:strand:- start:15156 stop:15509 length:354 start_codon:yes stop_codon:yes gene_type:complete